MAYIGIDGVINSGSELLGNMTLYERAADGVCLQLPADSAQESAGHPPLLSTQRRQAGAAKGEGVLRSGFGVAFRRIYATLLVLYYYL